MDLSTSVRLHVFDTLVSTGAMPLVKDISAALGERLDAIQPALSQLGEQHLLFLDPVTGEIRMAFPFSGVPTQHRVTLGDTSYYANCLWDSLGVAAALHQDASIDTVCGDCGETMIIEVVDGRPLPVPYVVHYAVPAVHWWDDIVYT
jgi:hypothetical protein